MIKSVFDQSEKVSIEETETGLKLSLKDVSAIDNSATSHWLQNGLIVAEIDFERDVVYLMELCSTVSHYRRPVDLETGVEKKNAEEGDVSSE